MCEIKNMYEESQMTSIIVTMFMTSHTRCIIVTMCMMKVTQDVEQ